MMVKSPLGPPQDLSPSLHEDFETKMRVAGQEDQFQRKIISCYIQFIEDPCYFLICLYLCVTLDPA